MHPDTTYRLVQLKIEEDLQYAARERLARAARKDRPRSIEIVSLGERLRVRLFGGPRLGGRPAAPTASATA